MLSTPPLIFTLIFTLIYLNFIALQASPRCNFSSIISKITSFLTIFDKANFIVLCPKLLIKDSFRVKHAGQNTAIVKASSAIHFRQCSSKLHMTTSSNIL